jgi:hypothetical protein
MLAEPVLDLAELDPEAAQLDLVVGSAEELEVAVRQPAHEVTGAVHAGARVVGERVANEALAGQLGLVQVPAGQARARDVQLADAADALRLERVAEHVELDVLDRLADRDRRRRRRGAGPEADVHGRLGRAVEVVQRSRVACVVAGAQVGRQRLAAAEHVADGRAPRPARFLDHRAQHRRDEVQSRHAEALDRRRQGGRVPVDLRLRDRQAGAVQQWPEELPDRHVEAEWGLLEHDVVGGEAILVLHPLDAIDRRPVLDHDALGAPRGARRVDDVGQVPGAEPDVGCAEVVLAELVAVAAQREHVRRGGQRRGVQMRLGDHDLDARVVDELRDARGRIGWVDRRVRASGLEDPEDRGHQLGGALHAQPDHRVGPDAAAPQRVADAVRPRVQLRIGPRGVRVHQRRAVRIAPDRVLEELVQAAIVRVGPRRVVEVVEHQPALRLADHAEP